MIREKGNEPPPYHARGFLTVFQSGFEAPRETRPPRQAHMNQPSVSHFVGTEAATVRREYMKGAMRSEQRGGTEVVRELKDDLWIS